MSYQDSVLINTLTNELGLAIVPDTDIYTRKRSRALGEDFLDILYEQEEQQQQKRNCLQFPTTYFAPSDSFSTAFLGMQQIKDVQNLTFGNLAAEPECVRVSTQEMMHLTITEEPEQVSYTLVLSQPCSKHSSHDAF